MKLDHNKLIKTYKDLISNAEASDEMAHHLEISRFFFEKHLWKEYLSVLQLAPNFDSGVVVDIGCKYGHVLPIMFEMGAIKCIGVDVEESYLKIGNAAFKSINFPATLVKSDEGYLPITSESVDFVFVNEVISHVNPSYLDTLYAEIARILKPGGTVLISDGNNRANASCVSDLNKLFTAWENGPVGVNTGRDIVDISFRDFRRGIIAGLHPELSSYDLDYLAHNTSGLFGDRLAIEVGKYLTREGWVERPYRPGICPTNPGSGGVVMERAFHPIQVELTLAELGICAHQVHMRSQPGSSLRNRLGCFVHNAKTAFLRAFAPDSLRGRTWAFQILGTKIGVPPTKWQQ
jgi:SAM-dependent methyltransferase